MPIERISVGKISDTYRYMVVLQKVPWKARYRNMNKTPIALPALLPVPAYWEIMAQ